MHMPEVDLAQAHPRPCVRSPWRSWEETCGDVFALARAVKLPLLLRDIFIHPVQVLACMHWLADL